MDRLKHTYGTVNVIRICLIATYLLVFLSGVAIGQDLYVNSQKVKDYDCEFATVIVVIKPMSRKMDGVFSDGIERPGGDFTLKNEAGEPFKFMSYTALYNAMYKNGWMYMDQSNSVSAGVTIVNVLFRKLRE